MVTSVSPKWLWRILLVLVIFAGLAALGLWDGFVKYPKRGREYASYALMEYFSAAQADGRLSAAGVSVAAPATELATLKQAAAGNGDPVTLKRREWLTALSRVEDLSKIEQENAGLPPGGESATVFADPGTLHDQLRQQFAGKSPPAALNALDIPSQHAIWVVSGALALFALVKLISAYTRKYRFDPATMRLTMPCGKSFVPEEIEDFDKRKWDKYLVFLKVRGFDGELKFDGLKYTNLEAWLLEMEKRWPGYVPEPVDEPASGAPAAGPTAT